MFDQLLSVEHRSYTPDVAAIPRQETPAASADSDLQLAHCPDSPRLQPARGFAALHSHLLLAACLEGPSTEAKGHLAGVYWKMLWASIKPSEHSIPTEVTLVCGEYRHSACEPARNVACSWSTDLASPP